MALNFEQKKAIVAEVGEIASKALSAVASDYRGLTVSELNELRKKAREAGVDIRVVRNTLARRALVNTEFACLSDILVGPMVLAFSLNEPGAAARVIRDFLKDHERLEVKSIALGGCILTAEKLESVAKLPTRDEALSILMLVMKAPITQYVRTMAEPYAKLVRTFAAIRDKKQAA